MTNVTDMFSGISDADLNPGIGHRAFAPAHAGREWDWVLVDDSALVMLVVILSGYCEWLLWRMVDCGAEK
ncbi:hypothetical protein KSX29_13570 [Photobacterium ganghwense]|nr:hypothetical protein [Photobacterium ganghwense]